MRNTKAVIAGALIAPALALTGGMAYASTSAGSTPATPRPAVTTTVQAHTQHTTTQPRHDSYCGPRYGDQRCDQWRHATQRQATRHHATQRQATRHHAYQHRGYRGSYGYQHRGGYGHQGNWGYRGSGQHGGGSWQGNGGGCCRGGW